MQVKLNEALNYKEIDLRCLKKTDRSWLIRELIKMDIDFKVVNKVLTRLYRR